MIQRIQTIYLLIAAICWAICAFFSTHPFYQISEANLLSTLFSMLHIVSAGWIFCTIFLFKKRQLQLRFCVFNMIVSLIALTSYLYLVREDIYKEWTVYTSLAGIVFCYLSIRGIRNDEKLIQSLDRLR